MQNSFVQTISIPLWAHAVAAVGSFLGLGRAEAWVNGSYETVKHPVSFFEGQTTFSGEAIKGHYAQLIEQGTFDLYVRTQMVDFVFILMVAAVGLFLCTFVARLGRPDSWGRRLGVWAGLAAIFGATCDAIENGWSFIMLGHPASFPDWIALPYSSFAAIKFGLIALAMLLLALSALAILIGRVSGKSELG